MSITPFRVRLSPVHVTSDGSILGDMGSTTAGVSCVTEYFDVRLQLWRGVVTPSVVSGLAKTHLDNKFYKLMAEDGIFCM